MVETRRMRRAQQIHERQLIKRDKEDMKFLIVFVLMYIAFIYLIIGLRIENMTLKGIGVTFILSGLLQAFALTHIDE